MNSKSVVERALYILWIASFAAGLKSDLMRTEIYTGTWA